MKFETSCVYLAGARIPELCILCFPAISLFMYPSFTFSVHFILMFFPREAHDIGNMACLCPLSFFIVRQPLLLLYWISNAKSDAATLHEIIYQAEVRGFQHDGSLHLQARSQKYGKVDARPTPCQLLLLHSALPV